MARPPLGKALALPRLAPEIDTKETFKRSCRSYVEERFDPDRIDDPFCVFNDQRKLYVALDAERLRRDLRTAPREPLNVHRSAEERARALLRNASRVNRHHGASDIASALTHEKCRHRRDVLRLSQSA